MLKKKYILGILIIVGVLSICLSCYFLYQYFREKNAEVIVDLNDTLTTKFLDKVKVSDFINDINGEIIDDYFIDTTSVGKKKVEFVFENEENIVVDYAFEIDIVDVTAPLIWLSGSYSVTEGSGDDWYKKIVCVDDYDTKPDCEVLGEYNVDKLGSYKLIFKATDNSGNVSEKNFTLHVTKPTQSSASNSSNSSKTTTDFQDIVNTHKNENTEIGLDISKWQGDVDFAQLKDAGVEFIFIRIGSTNGKEGDFFVDSKFEQNIKGANEVGIPVGLYFYSYASNDKQAKLEAEWIIDKIKNYQVDLPIVFDWENWTHFNDYELSLFSLTNMANVFVNTVEKAGYEGMLYSSKTYLENFWLDVEYPIWLAHYTKQTSYEGDFEYWQLCNNGRVNGINGDVDINVRYKN